MKSEANAYVAFFSGVMALGWLRGGQCLIFSLISLHFKIKPIA